MESDISSQNPQDVEAVEDLKMKERCGNVIENKGSGLEDRKGSGDILENKCSYALKAGMLLKTKGVDGMSYVVDGEERVPSVRCQVSAFRCQGLGATCVLAGSQLNSRLSHPQGRKV